MGSLELIIGPMYAGKSTELLRRTNREIHAGRSCQLFKPKIDDRYDKNSIATHDKIMRNAIPISSVKEIEGYLVENKVDIIGIDELQFLDERFIEFSKRVVYNRNNPLKIIASALASDFRGEPFKFMKSDRHIGEIMPYSQIKHEYAVCKFQVEKGEPCGADAQWTQRLIDGQPAPYSSPLILVGGAECYEARCSNHHFVPGHPYKHL